MCLVHNAGFEGRLKLSRNIWCHFVPTLLHKELFQNSVELGQPGLFMLKMMKLMPLTLQCPHWMGS